MQVYRHLDIGTAKPSAHERARVPHQMLDLVEPEEEFSVAEFQRKARAIIDENPETPFLIVGGSGLHYRATVDPLEFPPTNASVRKEFDEFSDEALAGMLLAVDPEAGSVVDLQNRRRVLRALEVQQLTGQTPSSRLSKLSEYRYLYPVVAVGLDPAEGLAERVSTRLDAMRQAGFLDEVARLQDRLGRTATQAVGYRQLLDVCRGLVDIDHGFAAVLGATLGAAKRQRTYFHRDPRIRWVPWTGDPQDRATAVKAVLKEASWTS